jgi:hypothetical protein
VGLVPFGVLWFGKPHNGLESIERGGYGLTQILTPLFTYDYVVFYSHSVDAAAHELHLVKNLTFFWLPSQFL